jgi:hypothetical protein
MSTTSILALPFQEKIQMVKVEGTRVLSTALAYPRQYGLGSTTRLSRSAYGTDRLFDDHP